MIIDLYEEIKDRKLILLVIPSVEYADTVVNLSSQLDENFNRVAYISLNRLIIPLKRSLQDKNIDIEKFFFIDGITKTAISNPPEMNNCLFIPAPNDLTKMSISLTKVMQTFDPDCLFFDSLSTLLVYEDVNIVTQLVYSMINKVNAYGIKIIFTCLDGEKEQQLINNLSLIVDKVIRP